MSGRKEGVHSYGIAGVSLIVFAAALRSAWRRFEGESATLSSILFGAGVAAGTVSLSWLRVGTSR